MLVQSDPQHTLALFSYMMYESYKNMYDTYSFKFDSYKLMYELYLFV